MTTLLWLRQDLRLADNPALHAAVSADGAVVPVYVYAPEEDGDWAPGGASRFWLHHSLQSLDAALRERGSRLLLSRGPALVALRQLARATGADRVVWNRRYEPAATQRDETVRRALEADGLEVCTFNASLLTEPGAIATGDGRPFQVFTAFWRRASSTLEPSAPRPAPQRIAPPGRWPQSLPLASLGLSPDKPWWQGLARAWQPGEPAAQARLDEFVGRLLAGYDRERDRPDHDGTSRLSPHLHFGEVSPQQVLAAILSAGAAAGLSPGEGLQSRFVTELGWREFAYHLLHHFPRLPEEPLRERFRRFPWRDDAAGLAAWQRGQTGVPIVDAGMRQLRETGWMHNRVRMIAASFLVKNLRVPWQHGARWFWDTLVDADLASNTLGWQWVAGCGADAAPYFRIFNPVSQARRFDPEGEYVRRFVPELSRLPTARIHAPWEATSAELAAAGVVPGGNYPAPLVDLQASRQDALAAFRAIRG
jgi:deoxyribodipyrimidine photo-lyase